MANENKAWPSYIQYIQEDISGRDTWNKKDNLILKRRLGERPTSKKPYPSAPEPIVNILNDTISYRTDMEISMIMNAPFFAYFIPINDTPPEQAMMAQRGFDTLLRHFMRYRKRKEEAVDCKNARGFSVIKRKRDFSRELNQVIPSFETVDPKDIIVPVDTQEISDAERVVHVLRWSQRKLKEKKQNGWKNIDKLLVDQDTESRSRTSTESEEDNALKVVSKLLGINVSDFINDTIVIWEIWHYATEWDVEHGKEYELKKDEPCRTYICPDFPEFLLFAKTVPTEEWPFTQHRFENRSRGYYDTFGLGHTCMDDHLAASMLMKRKLIWADYSTRPLLEDGGMGGDNNTSVKWSPGSTLPPGLKIAEMPAPPAHLDFDIDYFKRDASQRAGGGMNIFSGQASRDSGIEKTATEVNVQSAREAMLSSASTDRFNDADRELFRAMWEDCKKLGVSLPMINGDKSLGQMNTSVYEHDYIIVPAGSQKTLNPDMQFIKWKEAFIFAVANIQLVPNLNVEAELKRGLAMFDPQLTQTLFIDPNKQGPESQPPIYKLLEEINKAIGQNYQIDEQQQKEIEATMKLAIENSEKLESEMQKEKDVQPQIVSPNTP